MKFKDELRLEIIPQIDAMIKKEEEHLSWLKLINGRTKAENEKNAIRHFIRNSEHSLNYLIGRKTQCLTYIN